METGRRGVSALSRRGEASRRARRSGQGRSAGQRGTDAIDGIWMADLDTDPLLSSRWALAGLSLGSSSTESRRSTTRNAADSRFVAK